MVHLHRLLINNGFCEILREQPCQILVVGVCNILLDGLDFVLVHVGKQGIRFFAYVFFPSFMEKTFHIPSFAAMTVSELILTFLLLFVHLKFLRNTWLNKIPMVFEGITTVFIGGIDRIALSGLSTFMGISMAVLTEIIIVFLAVINKEKQVEQ